MIALVYFPTMTADIQPVLDVLTSQAGTMAVLAVLIYAVIHGDLIPRYVVRDKDAQIALWKQQSERWMFLALRGTSLAAAAAGLAEPDDPNESEPAKPPRTRR